jgi:hypothetical protein
MSVVLPDPRNPVTMVTGIFIMCVRVLVVAPGTGVPSPKSLECRRGSVGAFF